GMISAAAGGGAGGVGGQGESGLVLPARRRAVRRTAPKPRAARTRTARRSDPPPKAWCGGPATASAMAFMAASVGRRRGAVSGVADFRGVIPEADALSPRRPRRGDEARFVGEDDELGPVSGS